MYIFIVRKGGGARDIPRVLQVLIKEEPWGKHLQNGSLSHVQLGDRYLEEPPIFDICVRDERTKVP